MAQNISLLGANYSAVPAVLLPKTGGGTARFDDCSVTTAAAADVASGKVFVAADGTITTGTNSGGGGGSDPKLVMGTFTTPSTEGAATTITLPYTGSGYPIMATIVIDEGAYDTTTAWYTSIHRYAVGHYSMTKSTIGSTPTYQTSGAANYGVVCVIYKNSTSSNTSYSRTSTMNANVFSASNANATATTIVRFRSKTSMSIYVSASSGTSYGFLSNTKYRYWIYYSA